MDIIEDSQASPEVRQIRECNVGAYVVNAKTIFSALERLSPSPEDGDYRLTDCVHQLIRAGLCVESYRIYDPDEVQGINGVEDLARAEFILQKRLFRPRRQEERNLVSFGTGGWRAIIGEGFTMHNVRRLSQALANEITRQGGEEHGVVIGYDRRFLSRQAAEASAEVFAGNNVQTILLDEDAPTPLITYATAHAAPPTAWSSPPATIRRSGTGSKYSKAMARCCWTRKRGGSKPKPTPSRRKTSSNWNWTWHSIPALCGTAISPTNMWTRSKN